MPGVMPLVFAGCYQVFVYLLMFCLPKPGTYLPKVIEEPEIDASASTVTEYVKKDVPVLDKKEINWGIITEYSNAHKAPLYSESFHMMSFKPIYMDKHLSIQRPGMMTNL